MVRHTRAARHAAVDRAVLNREINAQLATQALRDQFATVGVDADGGTPDEFMAFIKSEIAKWNGVMQYAGMHKEKF